MTRYLMVTWDGAGNLVSTLGIARTLVADGHDVRMIGHASIQERCGDQGTRFTSFTPAADWDPLQVPGDFEEEMAMIRERLCFNPAIGATSWPSSTASRPTCWSWTPCSSAR